MDLGAHHLGRRARLTQAPPPEHAMTELTPIDEQALAAADETVGKEEHPRMLLHMPVDVRSLSLAVLAVLACLFVLRWASAVFVPVMFGVMFSYALSPIVDQMQRWRMPRALAAGMLMVAVVSTIGSTLYSLGDQAAVLVESLPAAAEKLRDAIRERRGGRDGTIEKVQQAATQLENAAEESATRAAKGRGVTRVQVEREPFNVKDYLWSGTVGLISFIGQVTAVCFITYFLMAAGNTFRRKLVKIAGPTFATKKITVQALDEINEQIQRYLLVQVAVSAIVGVATWLTFWWIGLEQAVIWGIAAGVLNLIPYIGSIVVTGAAALVAFLQFGTLDHALLVGGVSLVLHIISGYLLSPWLTSRVGRMNPVVIFVSVLAWGWLWGVWGLLLGIPIMMIVKAVCDRVEDLKPVGELLGD
jgi:predicted PurR-regulated permease PerM